MLMEESSVCQITRLRYFWGVVDTLKALAPGRGSVPVFSKARLSSMDLWKQPTKPEGDTRDLRQWGARVGLAICKTPPPVHLFIEKWFGKVFFFSRASERRVFQKEGGVNRSTYKRSSHM